MLGLKLILFSLFLAPCLAYPSLSIQEITPYTLLGCYFDDGNPRALPEDLLGDDKMTPQLCATHCAGYDFFGLEYGRECWCGNSAPHNTASESSCSFPCAGDATYSCGASNLMNVYMVAIISTSTTSKPSTSLHSSSAATIHPAVVTNLPVCHGDNCLNELMDNRFSASASSFCRTYTTTVNTNPAAIPTYLENCQSSPEYVSSACTCLFYTPPSTALSTSFSSSHIITSAPHSPTSLTSSSSKTSSSSSKTSSSSSKTSSSSSKTSSSSSKTSSSSSKTSSSSSKTSSSSSSSPSTKASSSPTPASTTTTNPSCVPTAFLMKMTGSGTNLDGTYLNIVGTTHSADVFTWTDDQISATQFVITTVNDTTSSVSYPNVLVVNSGPYQGWTLGSNDFDGSTYSIDPWPSVSLNVPVQCTPLNQYSGTLSCHQGNYGNHFYVWTEPLGNSIFLDNVPGFPVVPCTMVAIPVC